eukprot:TRINITY_DN74997_c0_g1_i1.p1 TRINITY_DN74997_c0_g1~~TRINITY_DN74997_c0_g1_i1.p1  ORF type:complete len:783 (+),score=94.09 TRINITY_DN74997_c0_g1_i1:160-2508(+)
MAMVVKSAQRPGSWVPPAPHVMPMAIQGVASTSSIGFMPQKSSQFAPQVRRPPVNVRESPQAAGASPLAMSPASVTSSAFFPTGGLSPQGAAVSNPATSPTSLQGVPATGSSTAAGPARLGTRSYTPLPLPGATLPGPGEDRLSRSLVNVSLSFPVEPSLDAQVLSPGKAAPPPQPATVTPELAQAQAIGISLSQELAGALAGASPLSGKANGFAALSPKVGTRHSVPGLAVAIPEPPSMGGGSQARGRSQEAKRDRYSHRPRFPSLDSAPAAVHCHVYWQRKVQYDENGRAVRRLGGGELSWGTKFLKDVMGIYHVGIEVHGTEYTFGNYRAPAGRQVGGPSSGIYAHEPKKAGPHCVFKEVCKLGMTKRAPGQVEDILVKMASEWQKNSYSQIHHNCVDFCRALSDKLGADDVPWQFYRGAYIGKLIGWGGPPPEETAAEELQGAPDGVGMMQHYMHGQMPIQEHPHAARSPHVVHQAHPSMTGMPIPLPGVAAPVMMPMTTLTSPTSAEDDARRGGLGASRRSIKGVSRAFTHSPSPDQRYVYTTGGMPADGMPAHPSASSQPKAQASPTAADVTASQAADTKLLLPSSANVNGYIDRLQAQAAAASPQGAAANPQQAMPSPTAYGHGQSPLSPAHPIQGVSSAGGFSRMAGANFAPSAGYNSAASAYSSGSGFTSAGAFSSSPRPLQGARQTRQTLAVSPGSPISADDKRGVTYQSYNGASVTAVQSALPPMLPGQSVRSPISMSTSTRPAAPASSVVLGPRSSTGHMTRDLGATWRL